VIVSPPTACRRVAGPRCPVRRHRPRRPVRPRVDVSPAAVVRISPAAGPATRVR
jgi:hypothetical protein